MIGKLSCECCGQSTDWLTAHSINFDSVNKDKFFCPDCYKKIYKIAFNEECKDEYPFDKEDENGN